MSTPKDLTDVAVAMGGVTQCLNYSGEPNGTNTGKFNPNTGTFPTAGTRAQQSAYMVETFGSGFGFPIGDYVPGDLVNNNRGPFGQHGMPQITPAVATALGLPLTYQANAQDAMVASYVPALWNRIVQLSASGGQVAAPVGAAPAVQQLAQDLTAAVAKYVAAT